MDLREDVRKVPGVLPEEASEGVLEYIQFVTSPPEVEPTEEGRNALRRGRKEFSGSEYGDRQDITDK